MAMLAHGLDKQPVDWEVIKRVDLIGIVTMAMGLGLLEVVLEEGNREDWFGSSFIVRLTVISVVALVFFVISQLLRRHPLVNLRLLHNPRFALACFAYLVLATEDTQWGDLVAPRAREARALVEPQLSGPDLIHADALIAEGAGLA